MSVIEKEIEFDGTFYSPRGMSDCQYYVIYEQEKVTDSFDAHNEMGSLQEYSESGYQFNLLRIDVRIFWGDGPLDYFLIPRYQLKEDDPNLKEIESQLESNVDYYNE